jgi:hypothetical protein
MKLNSEELDLANMIANSRINESQSSGRQDNHGASRSFQIDLIGAIGEIGFCKMYGLSYDRTGLLNTFKASDIVGLPIQIRATNLPAGKLIVRNADDDDASFYVLVICSDGMTVRCPGWLRGLDAKNPSYLFAPNGREPAYFVPQAVLNPPENLRNFIKSLRS